MRSDPNVTYCRQMKSYAQRWRVRRRKDDGIWCVIGRWGTIEPWSYTADKIGVVLSFRSERMLKARKRALQKTFRNKFFKITQEGDSELTIVVLNDENSLKLLKKTCGLYRKRKTSNRQKRFIKEVLINEN